MNKKTLVPPTTVILDDDGPGIVRPLHAGRAALHALPEERSGFIAVLRVRDFRLLWAAQAASQLADKFLMFTLLIVVYNLTKHSTLQSVLMVCYTFPSVFLSAAAGVYVDRHDKRLLMLATNLIRGILILLIPLSQGSPYLRDRAWPLLVITLAFSSVGQVFAPAEAASIPILVRPRQIMSATSLFMTTVVITLVAGVPTATLAIRFVGTEAPFFIAAGLFFIAAALVAALRTPLGAHPSADATERSLTRELREGVAILARGPALRVALAQLTVALMVVFTVFALGPAYLATVLHRSSADTYLILVPATLGMVAAAIALGHSGRQSHRARTLVMSALVGGVVLIGVATVPGVLERLHEGVLLVPAAVVLGTIFGGALGGLLIPAFTVLQERTTEESRGRIFGGIFTVINAAVAIPLLLAGGLADAFGVDRVVAGLGVALLLCGVLARTWLWHRIGVLDEPLPTVRAR